MDVEKLIELVDKREYDSMEKLANELAMLRAEDMATIKELKDALESSNPSSEKRVMSDTPTPETDAEGYGNGTHPYVPTDFARKLERERDEAIKQLAVFQDLLNDLADPLEMIINYWDQDERLESMTAACWHAVGTAEKALQKIKPHLTWYKGKEAVS